MTTTMPRVTGIASAVVNPQTRDLVLTVTAEGDAAYDIPVHPDIIGPLVDALLRVDDATAPPAGERRVTKVMSLKQVKTAIGPKGQLILDLVLEDDSHVPVTFPRQGIPALQAALAKLAGPNDRPHY